MAFARNKVLPKPCSLPVEAVDPDGYVPGVVLVVIRRMPSRVVAGLPTPSYGILKLIPIKSNNRGARTRFVRVGELYELCEWTTVRGIRDDDKQ